jgi:hypothetical protein
MAMRPPRAGSCPPNSYSCTAPTAKIRHALRDLASESGPGEGLNRVRRLRPMVAQAHDILRERFESGGSAEEYLRGRARLADSVVIGLLQVASISSGMRHGSMVAPLAAIAAGGYGLPDSRGPAARPLLDLFRYHARNIVVAIESAP